MNMTYTEFKSELDALADRLIELVSSVELPEDVDEQTESKVKNDARMNVVNVVNAIEDDFGEVLDN